MLSSLIELLNTPLSINNQNVCFLDVISNRSLFPEWKKAIDAKIHSDQFSEDRKQAVKQFDNLCASIEGGDSNFNIEHISFAHRYSASEKYGETRYVKEYNQKFYLNYPMPDEVLRTYICQTLQLTEQQVDQLNQQYESAIKQLAKSLLAIFPVNPLNIFYNRSESVEKEIAQLLIGSESIEGLLSSFKKLQKQTVYYSSFESDHEMHSKRFEEFFEQLMGSKAFLSQLLSIYGNMAQEIKKPTTSKNTLMAAQALRATLRFIPTALIASMLFVWLATTVYPLMLALSFLDAGVVTFTTLDVVLSLASALNIALLIKQPEFIENIGNYIFNNILFPLSSFIDWIPEKLFSLKINELSLSDFASASEKADIKVNKNSFFQPEAVSETAPAVEEDLSIAALGSAR